MYKLPSYDAIQPGMLVVRLFDARPLPAYASGGLVQAAEFVRQHGRGGDDILIHVNPDEFKFMQKHWGEPSYNPHTGLPEYGLFSKIKKHFKNHFKKVKKTLKKIAPYAAIIASVFVPALAPAIGAALGATGATAAIVGNAVIGAASGAVAGGGKGALKGALLGGIAGGGGGALGKAVGLSGPLASVAGNAVLSGAANSATGGSFGKGALLGGALTAATPYLNNVVKDTSIGKKLGLKPMDTLTSNAGSAASAAPTMSDSLDGTTGFDPSQSLDFDPSATTAGAASAASAAGLPGTTGLDLSNVGNGAFAYGDFARNSLTAPLQASAPAAPTGIKGALSGAIQYAKDNPIKSALGLASVIQSATAKPAPVAGAPALPPGWDDPLPTYNYQRKRRSAPIDYYHYGEAPEQLFFDDNTFGDTSPSVNVPSPNPGVPSMGIPSNPYTNGRAMAAGGITQGRGEGPLSATARYVSGGTGAPGRADNIDAKLSENEYVFDAETVALLGDGNPEAGAAKLDAMRSRIRKQKGRALAKGKISPNAKDAMAYLGGAR